MDSKEAQKSRGNALYDEGLQAFRRREQEHSRLLNQESLLIFRALGEPTGTAKALIGLARVAIREHDFAAVRNYASEAAGLLEGRGENRVHGGALHMLAAVHRMSGEDAEAARLYERTTEMYHAVDHAPGVAGELMNHGYARLHLGETDDARNLFDRSLDQTSALGDPVATAFGVASCAAYAAHTHNDEQAACSMAPHLPNSGNQEPFSIPTTSQNTTAIATRRGCDLAIRPIWHRSCAAGTSP